MQIFNLRDGHVTTFRHPSGTYICQIPVGCAQDSRRVPQNHEKCCFFLSGSVHATKCRNFSW